MKLIILAAGYATRLYPLTLDKPKPLLEVAGRPMIEHVLASLGGVPQLDRVYVVTNAKFAGHFERWAKNYAAGHDSPPISVINDGTTDDSNKLGAIGDLDLVLTREGVDDDVIVVAGDNLFDRGLEGFLEFCLRRGVPVVGVYDVGDLEQIRKYNNIGTDAEGRITSFEEKPEHPVSTVTAIALYYYPKAALPLIRQYVAEGNNPDQPGRLVQWMHTRTPFYTWKVPGTWYDIGSKETLAEADSVFSKGKSEGAGHD
ncbi:MAG TPA: nucleotidyltransferase family protein [Pyrinomonadaceae bacterium]